MPLVRSDTLLLLIHGNDVKDVSPKNIALGGNATTTTEQKKFFNESIRINGTSSYISLINPILGTGDYTMDYWYYIQAVTTVGTVYSIDGSNSRYGVFNNRKDVSTWYADGTKISASYPSQEGWHHCAWVRNNGETKLYIDGTLRGQSSYNPSFQAVNSIIGYNQSSSSSEYFNGFIDEFCIRNYAVWTENFTPPTSKYYTENLKYKVNGEWKNASVLYKTNGEWKNTKTLIKNNGSWKS